MKKKRSLIASCLFVCLSVIVNAQFNYISPVPGSKYHYPQETIILKTGEAFDENSTLKKDIVEIYGSKSGKHGWKTILSENKTLIIKPEPEFAWNETVTVIVHNNLKKKDGTTITGNSFSFDIRNGISTEERERYLRSDKEIIREDFPNNILPEQLRTGNLDSMPTFVINVNNNPAHGQIFYDNQSDDENDTNSFPTIINNNGSIIWAKDLGMNGHDFKINYNGYLTYYDLVNFQWIIMDSNYNRIDSVQCGNGYELETNGHDCVIYPDKHTFLLAYDDQTIDMSQVVAGGNSDATVKGLIVQELDIKKNVVFQWRSWDHFQITDADSNTVLTGLTVDYVHGNAVERDNDGNIMVSCRNLCEITKINTSTGDIIWRMGGENNQFKFLKDNIPQHFSYQHDIRRITNGHVTLFNDGDYLPVQISSAKEYALDEVNKVATLTWYYEHPDINGNHVYGRASGSTQRLPNGNTMISWGTIYADQGIPNITEVDLNKNITWEMTFDDGTQRSYRTHKYAWNPCSRITSYTMNAAPGKTQVTLSWGDATGATKYKVYYRMAGTGTWITAGKTSSTQLVIKNLITSTKYEWRVKTICSGNGTSHYSETASFTTLSARETDPLNSGTDLLDAEVYPNPAFAVITLSIKGDSGNEPALVTIRNMLGEIQMTQEIANAGQIQLNVQNLSKGFYTAEIRCGAKSVIKKFIKE
ncbi:MAG: aryl-sulfate sulfotransferase [Chitinophagales bacterium]|nr:aryl-sulfate sulfotransferase [Chitinophagales bacterium]